MNALGRSAGPDPFDTAALRDAALDTWRRDPSRLRQDANLEEDHARGSYRDRVIVELAQNAADAAAEAGVPGDLVFRLTSTEDGGELLAANTGRPLTRAGVAALATLRASAKRAGEAPTVGRFGVGFSATRSLSDEITVATRTEHGPAGVRFSLAETAALLDRAADDIPDLAREIARRQGDLPALRLPVPLEDTAAEAQLDPGRTTAVRLRLRGPAEREAARSALEAVDDVLLLALPTLRTVRVEIDDAPARVLADVGSRWRTATAAGRLPEGLVADRPVEERDRTGWSVTWALPRVESGSPPALIHAPTPTEDPVTLPALLVATFPLDPTRRRAVPGPVTEYLLARAAEVYADLAVRLAGEGAAEEALGLVPTGLPAGPIDGAVHAAVLETLAGAGLLTEVGTGELITARSAQSLAGPAGQDPEVLGALAPMVGGLVRVPAHREVHARRLGVAIRDLADVVETLPAAGPPERWRQVYAALAPHAATHREALSALPVPLHDGTTFAHGPHGLLLPSPELTALPAGLPGLRIVHPRAAHPVLATVGAVEADAVTLLQQPSLRAAVEDPEGPSEPPAGQPPDGVNRAVAVVLDLAAQAVARHGDDVALPAWLAELPLPVERTRTDLAPAAELTIPGSWAAEVLDALEPVARRVLDHWGGPTLAAVGVRADLTTVTVPDVVADPAAADETRLDGWSDYLEHLAEILGPGAWVGDLIAVADLDAVAEGAWPQVLERLAATPALRAALLDPVRAEGGGTGTAAPSYTAWWLREELGAPFALPGRRRAPFLTAPPAGIDRLDEAVLGAVGAVGDLAELDAAGWDAYLDRWPEEGTLDLTDAVALWRGLARAATEGVRFDPPTVVPALTGANARMCPADDVVVATPMWAQAAAVVPAPLDLVDAVADLLDLDVAPDVPPAVTGHRTGPTPAAVRTLLPEVPAEWVECEELEVDGSPVTWWVNRGTVYATSTAGLARALAHAAGSWPARFAVEAVLTDPTLLGDVLAECAGDPPGTGQR